MTRRTDPGAPPRATSPPRRAAIALDRSAKARRSVLGLFAVLAYLLLGQLLVPGFTHYWGFHVAQVVVVLACVLVLETVFAPEGGLAWPTHVIVVATVAADAFGTASDLYHLFEPYDKLIHFASGAAFAAAAYDVLDLLGRRGRFPLSAGRRLASAITASFLVAGLAWELYEQLGDLVFSTDRVQSRQDTIHDLVSNFCGSFLAASVLWIRETTRGGVARRSMATSDHRRTRRDA